jgi:AcrR family transcriptional regulator
MAAALSRADTRARVLAAAAALFAARGFHGTTARDIAERAKVNLASAHYHFGSKEALYIEVLRVQVEDVNRVLERRGVATIADPRAIAGILAHLGLEPPRPVPPRQPSWLPPDVS